MDEQTFRTLVDKGESDTVELKLSFDKEAIETLAAFANTKGGTIVIGIQNSNHQMRIHEISDLHLKTHHSIWDHYTDL